MKQDLAQEWILVADGEVAGLNCDNIGREDCTLPSEKYIKITFINKQTNKQHLNKHLSKQHANKQTIKTNKTNTIFKIKKMWELRILSYSLKLYIKLNGGRRGHVICVM